MSPRQLGASQTLRASARNSNGPAGPRSENGQEAVRREDHRGAQRQLLRANVNLRDVTASQRRLLGELTGRISNRLEAHFAEPSGADSLNIGVMLQERGRRGSLEVPETVLLEAETDLVARDSLRVRIKSRSEERRVGKERRA